MAAWPLSSHFVDGETEAAEDGDPLKGPVNAAERVWQESVPECLRPPWPPVGELECEEGGGPPEFPH